MSEEREVELSAYIFVPADRFAELVAVSASGRVQMVTVTGTKLRYRSGQATYVGAYTDFSEEEW
jgi:hypothetical protein